MISIGLISRQFFVYGISDLIGRFFVLALIPLLTRYLTPAEFGALDASLSFIIFFSLLFGLQLESAFSRYYYECEEKGELTELISTSFWGWTLAGLMGSILLAMIAPLLASVLYPGFDNEAGEWIRLLALCTFANLCFQKTKNIIRFQQRAWLYAVVNVLPPIIVSILFLICIKKGFGISALLLSFAIAYFIGAMTLWSLLRAHIRFQVSGSLLKRLLAYSLPCLPAVTLGWGQRHGLRLVILSFFSMVEMGIYGIADKLAMAFAMFNIVFRKAWEPHAMKILNSDRAEEALNRLFGFYMAASLLYAFFLTWASPYIIELISPPQYWEAKPLAGWLVGASVLLGMFDFAALGNDRVKKPARNLPGLTVTLVAIFAMAYVAFMFTSELVYLGYIVFFGTFLGIVITFHMSERAAGFRFMTLKWGLVVFSLFLMSFLSSFTNSYVMFLSPLIILAAYFSLVEQDRVRIKCICGIWRSE